MDRSELNKKVHVLLDRTSNLQPSLELRAKLRHDCTLLQASIKKLQENMDHSELPPLPQAEEASASVQEQLRRLKMELAIWKDMEPEIPHVNEESLKSVEWLEQVKECNKAVSMEKSAVKAKIKKEVKYLEEVKEIKQTLLERTDLKQQHENGRSETADIQDQKKCEGIKSKMKWFIEKCLPEPNHHQRKKKSEAALGKSGKERALDFIQNLVSNLLDSPDDPYLDSGDLSEDWYLLLLQSGVIQRHPTDNALVRLTPFHH